MNDTILYQNKYGVLLTPDIKLHRKYFDELVGLIGITLYYRAPKPNKTYTFYGEIDSNYQEPEAVGCIFDEHPDQQTLKRLGWVAELQEGASIVSVPYDLHDLQQGSLFYLPSGLDNAPPRLFRVTKMSTIMVYPASITCELVPEYPTELPVSLVTDFKGRDFTLLTDDEEPDE